MLHDGSGRGIEERGWSGNSVVSKIPVLPRFTKSYAYKTIYRERGNSCLPNVKEIKN